ncbi:MAG: nucleoside monophosphate kinase [Anaerolineaceae bacterium]|nr:nucleoside monophosphate kinase [Anaerolineaceae bacterium]MCY3907919.1 nucleoside monophosphate kinase [Anaerolineaceae bacterium]
MGLYLILLGVQGAGKGVQAAWIQQHYGIPHVSTGDLFRAMRTREDELAQRIQAIMASGQLISDEITNEVVRDRLSQPDAAGGAILDGFPRNEVQAAWLDDYLASKGEAVNAVLLMEIDLYVAFKRAYGRIASEDGARIYNLYYQNENIDWRLEEHPEGAWPPRVTGSECDTGMPLVRRPDDASADVVIRRIDTYLETSMPLVNWYRGRGLLRSVDAEQSIEDVSAAIQAVIETNRS